MILTSHKSVGQHTGREITQRGKMVIESVHKAKDGKEYPVEIIIPQSTILLKNNTTVFLPVTSQIAYAIKMKLKKVKNYFEHCLNRLVATV